MGGKYSQFYQKYDSRLHRAVARGDMKTTRYLVENGGDVNMVDGGHVLVNIAMHRRKDELLQYLLSAGCHVNPDPSCVVILPLIQGVMMGHVNYVTSLLRHGSNVNQMDKRDKTALHTLVSHTVGRATMEILELLLTGGADINKQDRDGFTALHLCSVLNKTAVARRLLETRACDVDLLARSGRTALMEAIENGHAEVGKLLVEAGCSLEIPDGNGRTPLIAAVQADQTEVLTAMLISCANPDKTDNSGMTSLHYAVQRSRPDYVNLLLTHNAAVNVRDSLGRTPLMVGASRLSTDGTARHVIEVLLDHGADHSLSNIEGRVPLHTAARFGLVDVAMVLLSRHADVTCVDNSGKTPLMTASNEGKTGVARILIDHGSNLNHRDCRGKTPLYMAALHGHGNMVDLLLKGGAHMDIADYEGNAPLHLTVRFPSLQPRLMWRLVQEGCDPLNLDAFLDWIIVHKIISPSVLFADAALEKWYQNQRKNPWTLKQLCRVALQDCLNIGQRDIPRDKVAKLPLPKLLVDYVSMKLL